MAVAAASKVEDDPEEWSLIPKRGGELGIFRNSKLCSVLTTQNRVNQRSREEENTHSRFILVRSFL